VAWIFEPCQKIGGDIFNLIRLSDHHWVIYMLDVSGHGVPAAMVAVSVSQVLQQLSGFIAGNQPPPTSPRGPLSPAEALEALDQAFPFERFNNFFTMNIFLLDTSSGRLQFSNAGHPHPFLLHCGGHLDRLSTRGLAIGIRSLGPPDSQQFSFQDEQVTIQPGDKLIIYTDGVTEYQNLENDLYGEERLCRTLLEFKDHPIHEVITAIESDLRRFGNHADPLDDITLLGIEIKKRKSH
jgi:sigma-B regulation protein RsbU (phosphoserine phosphatase)